MNLSVEAGGFARFRAKANTVKRAARKLPKALSRKVIKNHLTKVKNRAAKAVQHAQRNVQRLGTAKLMDYGALPWAEKQTRPLHAQGKGTGKIRKPPTQMLQDTAGNIANKAQSLQDRTKKHQDQIKNAARSIKGSRLIYLGLRETKFKALVTPKGKMQETIAKARAKFLNQYDKLAGTVGKHSQKFKTVAEYGNAIAKGELIKHVVDSKVASVQASAEAKLISKASMKTGAKIAAKSAGRFVPGMNIVVAGMDIHKAVKTITDPKASTYKKVMYGATALLSIGAATNIPGVSQIAAGLSILTSVAAELKPEKMMKGIKQGLNNFFKAFEPKNSKKA